MKERDMKILITGGAGFIGSAVIRYVLKETKHSIINIDSLTYAGNLDSLAEVEKDARYSFEYCDISNAERLKDIFESHKPSAVMHLAAETHVDRSIDNPGVFIKTNVNGTYNLLEISREYFRKLNHYDKQLFRFHHVSTDEVFGDLGDASNLFTEETPYSPSSPYSASKAASDHLARSWLRTYGLPVIVTNCSNNYGPFHFPEKLIPHMIINAINGKPLPIYGNGAQVRDWLYVEDHAKALIRVLMKGKVGENYNIGGNNEKTNFEVVQTICDLLEELAPGKPLGIDRYEELITFVKDRPGHDVRYAIDASKIQRELGWVPEETFETGLRKTIEWYLKNTSWWERVISGDYRMDRIGTDI